MKKILLCFFIISVMSCHPAFAESGGQAAIENQSCRDIADLAEKYGAEKKLPESVVVGGKPCPKNEAAQCLMSILEKVCDKCGKEGCQISDEDREKIARLHDALKDELSKYQGYLERREIIESILAKPEIPSFLVRAGVNGFIRGEGVGNFRLPNFSYAPGHGEGRFLYRVKPYVYWHPTDYLDIHAEGQGYGFTGTIQEYSRFSLYQGFIEAKLPESDVVSLKAGRQEFSYGSTFILGTNSFYDGLVFDALRLRVKPWEPLSIDLLGGWYGHPFSTGLKGDMEGVYVTYTVGDKDAVEAYVFRDTGQVERHSGQQLYIYGLRGTAGYGPFSLEVEPIYESGRIFNPDSSANDEISAYGGHIDLTADATIIGLHTKFLGGYAIGSGSKKAAEGTNLGKEFHNPDNDTYQAGDISVISDFSGITVAGHRASGLQCYTLGFGADILKNLNFSGTGHYFMANAVPDGFSRNVGLETDFTATWSIDDHFTLVIGYDHFFTGGFFKDAAGKGGDVDYGYAMLQFDYSVSKLKKRRI